VKRILVICAVTLGWIVPAGQLRAAQSNAVSASGLIERGRSDLASSLWEAAVADFRQATELEPTNATAYAGLGYSLARLGWHREAVETLKQALALNPQRTNSWYHLGESYSALGDYNRAVDAYRAYVSLNTNNARAYIQLGNALAEDDRFPEAVDAVQKAVTISPSNSFYYSTLGYYLMKLRRYDEADNILDTAVSLNPKDAYSYLWLGVCRYHQKSYPKAVAALQKSVAIETNNPDGYYWLGNSLYAMQHYSGAVTAYEKGLRIRPDDFEMNYGLGYTYAEMRRYDRAVAAFQKAVRIRPDDFDANNWRAICQVWLGRFDEAAASFERAHELRKNDLITKRALFACYLLSAQYVDARRLYPMGFAVGGSVLLLVYAVALTVIWRFSSKISEFPAPGLGLSIWWLAVFFEGQLALMFCLALLSLIDISQNLLFGITLAGIPVIAAAARAFPRQPWGGPFAFPLRFGTARVIGLSLLGLAAASLFGSWCAPWIAEWLHRPSTLQEVVPIIRFGLGMNPVATVVSVVIVAPICEEIIFRGLLYGALENRLGVAGAILISAVVFAVVHLQITYFIGLLGVGIVLGWARWKTGSLGLPIVLHIINNAAAMLMLQYFEKRL